LYSSLRTVSLRSLGVLVPGILAFLLLAGVEPLHGQEPPDTLRPPPDTIPRPDTLVGIDTLQVVPGEGEAAVADSLMPADSLAADSLPPPDTLPAFPRGSAEGWERGVWEWEGVELLTIRALTVAELLEEIPSVNLLRGGDYGMPIGASAFGGAGGRLRVFFDGIEIPAIDGGVPDLSRIGIGGLGRIRITRRMGEVRVDLNSRVWGERRPYTVVEAGTGDLDTNVFRGTFVDGDALRGSLGVSLDRTDTDGPARKQPSTFYGGWLRYALHFGSRGGIQFQARRASSRRGETYFPDETTQTDLTARVRYLFGGGFLAESFVTSSRLEAGDSVALDSLRFSTDARTQVGGRLGWQAKGAWVDASYRMQGGGGWPETVSAVRGGLEGRRWGGFEAGWERQEWRTVDATRTLRAGVWSPSIFGLTLFGEWEDGTVGAPGLGLERTRVGDPEDVLMVVDSLVPPQLVDRTGLRLGARFSAWGADLGGAFVRIETDSLGLLGLAMDRGGVVLPGGERTGWEAYGSLPLWPRGFRLEGSYSTWDDAEGEAWRYLPGRQWSGVLRYDGTFFPSGNLEVGAKVGVRGRDGMVVPFLDPEAEPPEEGQPPVLLTVPFYQSWYFDLQVRIVSVRLFLRVDNIANRVENRDFPGVPLPGLRAMYGVRWILLN
jgi:hypothetical protein